MKTRTTAALVAFGLSMTVSGAVIAQSAAQLSPAEKAIDYRKAVYKIVAGNFGPLAQGAQGKIELTPAASRAYAQRLASIAEFTRDAFPEVSKEGPTKAKPSIWSESADFDKLIEDLNVQAKALAAVTARADAKPEEFKAA